MALTEKTIYDKVEIVGDQGWTLRWRKANQILIPQKETKINLMNLVKVVMDNQTLLVVKINWGMIGLILFNTLVWISIFTKGFWTTLLWVMIGVCISLIIIKTKENTRV